MKDQVWRLVFYVSLVCFNLEYFHSLSLPFMTLPFIENMTPPPFAHRTFLSNISSWSDLRYAFLGRILCKCFCVLPGVSLLEVLDVHLPLFCSPGQGVVRFLCCVIRRFSPVANKQSVGRHCKILLLIKISTSSLHSLMILAWSSLHCDANRMIFQPLSSLHVYQWTWCSTVSKSPSSFPNNLNIVIVDMDSWSPVISVIYYHYCV